ncbi:GtrA family protein [Vibrio coralliilyticus]|uniref:GtrA family protein n=1 Tax=Vibrio coralliilyticus TaxID=190893 RepID=UPI0006CC40F9|nr:GtrA family protein [Vibrio coralliilyticus]AXN30961.1 GtrA family protein [Vibrio coralliilyticus]KPH27342.1 polysaccharide biosynthesis protein GtrA [Vibrio coralliilyticus]
MINKLWRFALVGGVGFIADASLFALLFYGMGLPILDSRIVAFLFAATVTWLGNRIFTFASRRPSGKFLQWIKFMGCATFSAVPNFGVFKLTTYFWGSEGMLAMFAMALGVLAGMLSNFLLSHWWVFCTQSHSQTESQP